MFGRKRNPTISCRPVEVEPLADPPAAKPFFFPALWFLQDLVRLLMFGVAGVQMLWAMTPPPEGS